MLFSVTAKANTVMPKASSSLCGKKAQYPNRSRKAGIKSQQQ